MHNACFSIEKDYWSYKRKRQEVDKVRLWYKVTRLCLSRILNETIWFRTNILRYRDKIDFCSKRYLKSVRRRNGLRPAWKEWGRWMLHSEKSRSNRFRIKTLNFTTEFYTKKHLFHSNKLTKSSFKPRKWEIDCQKRINTNFRTGIEEWFFLSL